MSHRGTETEFELTTIERLERQGYIYRHGDDLERSHGEVVLKDRLLSFLKAQYPDIPDEALEEAMRRFAQPEGVDTVRRNMDFHQKLTRGVELAFERDDGTPEHRLVYPVAWDDPDKNEFLVVNQLRVSGQNDRRPDIVIFVNGLPLVLFELKNPYDERPSVEHALNQIAHYRHEIPQLFEFNVATVISDGVTTLHGMWTASREWYAPWKSIDGFYVEPNTTGTMKTLVEGLFPKARLLNYARHFIVFEVNDQGKITKKGAKYHQFFAVRLAAEKAVQALTTGRDKRLGVIWHTTGSGKSLSMTFLVALLRRHPALNNPTFVIEVDRTDLDDQLHDQFVAARALVGDVKQAGSVDDLRALLRTEGGEVIFTTVEKFRLKRDAAGGETEHPVLSTRDDIIVIADEAHRSQYGFAEGYARYLAEALPNARRLGFTGTPVSLSGADTVEVFGDVIHTYDIHQSQEDKATVPIYYVPRQIKLRLGNEDIDTDVGAITDGFDVDAKQFGKWTALAKAAGTTRRVEELAKTLLDHYLDRSATLKGKAMAVCMTRENCVRLYDALTALPGCPEVKVVMTGDLGKDPAAWSEAGHLTTKAQRDAIKMRMIDEDDPLKLVIVCDMWLTGTDIPCLHTLYIDKPMRGHTMIQAISRVNRVFKDKPHGMIVDFIGIADELREATSRYTRGGGTGDPAPNIQEEAMPIFLSDLAAVRERVPAGQPYGAWRALSRIDLEDLYALVYGHVMADETQRDAFLEAENRLSKAFLLVKHLDEGRPYADEVVFYQRVRKQLRKTLPGGATDQSVDLAVRDLMDDSVQTEGVVDIFAAAGFDRADLSILDEEFLQTYKDREFTNLQLKLLEKLAADEIRLRQKKNLAQAESFKKRLEKTLQSYHNRLIDAAAVVRAMIAIREELAESDVRAESLGLSEEELAFYDAIYSTYPDIYDDAFLRDLIHDIVASIRRNLKVDWTEPHREDIKAAVRAAVRRVLRQRNVKREDWDTLIVLVMSQAEALYKDWTRAA